MIVAVVSSTSRGAGGGSSTSQLFVSRVVLAQCFTTPNAHNNGKKLHTKSHHSNKPSSSPSHPLLPPPLSPYHPLLSVSPLSFISTSLFSPINVFKSLGRRAASGPRRLSLPEKQRMYISSPAQLISPFIPPTQHPSIFSRKGLSSRLRAFKSKLMNIISAQQIKNSLKQFKEKFTTRIFRGTADTLYQEINKAIAAGDGQKLRGLLTESMYTTIAREVGLKERAGDKLHSFDWTANLQTPEIVCVRFTRVSAEKLEDFAQVTVFFKGTQTLTVCDVAGKVISSTSSPVEEFWTFERHLQKFNSSWKLCAKPTRESIEAMGL